MSRNWSLDKVINRMIATLLLSSRLNDLELRKHNWGNSFLGIVFLSLFKLWSNSMQGKLEVNFVIKLIELFLLTQKR